jgi:hypothetical protein
MSFGDDTLCRAKLKRGVRLFRGCLLTELSLIPKMVYLSV